MPRPPRRLTASLVSLGLALAGLTAAAAPATANPSPSTAPAAVAPGTLVFVKNHNVWMSRGDGSGQVQITKDGTASEAYTQPSMPRRGVIAAIKGKSQIVHAKTDGSPLSSWDSKTLFPVGEAIYQNTTSLDISPDGTKAAYGQWAYVELWSSAFGAKYSAANQLAPFSGTHLYFSDQTWISNDRVLLRRDGGIHVYDLGAAEPVEWFQEKPYFAEPGDHFYINEDLFDPELSADGSRLVTMRGPEYDPTMLFFSVTGNARTSVPPAPELTCQIGNVSGYDPSNPTTSDASDPTIAPNNRTVVWQDTGGIYVKDNIDVCSSSDIRLLIAGGADPSWSAVAYEAPSKPAPPKPDPKPGDKIALTAAPVITGAAKVGKTLKASKGSWKPAPKKFAYQWQRNGKAIKKATKSSYKLTAADAGKKITVTVTVTRASYKKASATSKAKAIALYNVKKPTIKKATAKVGKKLKVTKGTWKGKPKSYAYQWYRGKKKITGATNATYKLSKSDRGKKIRVKVTAKRTGYPKATAYTARTKKVR